MSRVEQVRALTFDVFGTVVDWYGSIVAEGAALSRATGTAVDWPAFALAWRAGYQPAMQRVRTGEVGWTKLDDLHRQILDGLLVQFGITGLDEATVAHLNRVWHRLLPWPDSIGGLGRLRGRFIVAALSNGNMALLVNMAKRAGLPWDCILSAELMRRYKPDPAVYTGAAELLGLAPEQVMMVAAHPLDLLAAAEVGMRTAYVPRPLEYGPGGATETTSFAADLIAADFHELADRLLGV